MTCHWLPSRAGGGGQRSSYLCLCLATCGTHAAATASMSQTKEFLRAEKRLLDAAAAGDRTRGAKVIDLCKLFGSAETLFRSLRRRTGHRYGRRQCTSHLACLQSGGEAADRRAWTGRARGNWRAGYQETKTGERGPGSRTTADTAGHQTAATDAEAGRAAAVAVGPATPYTEEQQRRRVRQGLRRRARRWRPGRTRRPWQELDLWRNRTEKKWYCDRKCLSWKF